VVFNDSDFAYAYYYDDLKSKNLDADFSYRWKGTDKRNPRYYQVESDVRNYLGFSRSKMMIVKINLSTTQCGIKLFL
jgi:hypothetical protein